MPGMDESPWRPRQGQVEQGEWNTVISKRNTIFLSHMLRIYLAGVRGVWVPAPFS